jgi:hypothetical protein
MKKRLSSSLCFGQPHERFLGKQDSTVPGHAGLCNAPMLACVGLDLPLSHLFKQPCESFFEDR